MSSTKPFLFPNKSTYSAWLKSLQPYEPIAEQAAVGMDMCPISRYFFTHGKEVSVGFSSSIDVLEDVTRDNPKYVNELVKKIDSHHRNHDQITPADVVALI